MNAPAGQNSASNSHLAEASTKGEARSELNTSSPAQAGSLPMTPRAQERDVKTLPKPKVGQIWAFTPRDSSTPFRLKIEIASRDGVEVSDPDSASTQRVGFSAGTWESMVAHSEVEVA